VEDAVKNVVKNVGDWRTASTIKNATAPTSTRTMGEARLERNRACAKGGFQHGWRNGRSGAARPGGARRHVIDGTSRLGRRIGWPHRVRHSTTSVPVSLGRSPPPNKPKKLNPSNPGPRQLLRGSVGGEKRQQEIWRFPW
jgi:hypothetical protein